MPALTRIRGSAKALSCVAVLSSALLAAPTAHADWRLPPEQLAPTLRTPHSWAPPVVAVGREGEASALMLRWDLPNDSLFSVDRTAGGTWGAPIQVPSGAQPLSPELATSPGGEQTAAWFDTPTGEPPYSVWTSRREAGGAWQPSAQMPLYAAEDHFVDGPAVAEDAAGDAVVVWAEADAGYTSQWLVASEWHAGAWSAPQRILSPSDFIRLSLQGSIASDGPGEFVLGWIEEGPAPGIGKAEAEMLRGGSWTGEQVLESVPDQLYGLSLAANDAGQAAMTWADESTEAVHAASMSGGAWTVSNPASTHVHVVCDEAPPQVGIDASGMSRALWQEASGRLTSERMGPGGGWAGDRETVAIVPEGWTVYGMHLGVDREGDALASWTALQGESPWASTVQVDSELAGESWKAPLTLASGAGGWRSPTALDFGREGFGVAAWQDELRASESEETYDFSPRSVVFEGMRPHASGPGGASPSAGTAPAGDSTPRSRPRLGPVYLLTPSRRLWLARHGRKVTQKIRNTNPFPVSGTATIYEYFLGKTARAASRRVATTVRFRLAAGQTAPVSFRIRPRALRRLRSFVPDRGHILVSVHLAINGEGQSASSSVVMALDQPQRPRRHAHRPRIPRGYPAPVDPWARKAC